MSEIQVRKRQRPPALQALIEQVTYFKNGYDELVLILRDVQKRLRRYEHAPPMFPAAMLEQIKLVHRLGFSNEQIASAYDIDKARVDRTISDTEMPLVVIPKRMPKPKGRMLRV